MSFLVDGILQAIPFLGVVNWIMFRRGNTIGLKLIGARIVRENGDVSGFFHTSVRAAAGALSMIPLGLGYWWAFCDPWKQTWHDKIMRTYVMRDTPELASRGGSSSRRAETWFWVLLAVPLTLILLAVVIPNVVPGPGRDGTEAREAEFYNIETAVITLMVDNAISTILTPVSGNTAPCIMGTQDMAAFPDTTSNSANGGKVIDFSGNAYDFDGMGTDDKPGYLIFGHDITAEGAPTPTVNYLRAQVTTYCYTVDSNGNVRQYLEDGKEIRY